MALYLGSNRVGIAVPGGTKCATGTIVSDSHGVITFPELEFTPKMITVWNVRQIDNKASAEEDGEEWDESYVRYTYDGVMLTAIKQDDMWFSQGISNESSGAFISNSSWNTGGNGTISISDNIYSYTLDRYGDNNNYLANKEFNYAIYG